MTTQQLYDTIVQEVETLCTLIREKDFNRYQDSMSDSTYNPQPLLKKLQKLKNSLEDIKSYL